MDDETIELCPPTPRQVAIRALNLSAVVCRGNIDKGAGAPEAEDLLARIRAWLRDSQLEEGQEPWEKELLGVDLGQLSDSQVARATWAVEGLAVLAWALGKFEFPRHDQKTDAFAVTDSLGFLSPDAREFVDSAHLRSTDDLAACREVMYAVHCRLRNFLHSKSAVDFSTWLEPRWLQSMAIDPASLMVDGDLAIVGKNIRQASRSAVQECEWAVTQHHRAGIWLIGEEFPTYWDWGVDT